MTRYDLDSFLEKVTRASKKEDENRLPQEDVDQHQYSANSDKKFDEILSYLRRLASSNTNIYNIGGMVMGDVIKGIEGSTVINGSNISNSFNRLEMSGQGELAAVLKQLWGMIDESGDRDATQLYERFVEEASKPQRSTSVLKALWSGIESTLPTVKTATDIVATVGKLML